MLNINKCNVAEEKSSVCFQAHMTFFQFARLENKVINNINNLASANVFVRIKHTRKIISVFGITSLSNEASENHLFIFFYH